MAEPLVERSDVETALVRPLTTKESPYIDNLCSQASAKLRTALPGVDARINLFTTDPTTPTGLDPEVVSVMLAEVIKRVLTNPQGLYSGTTSSGPFSSSRTFASSRSATGPVTGLRITAVDLAELDPVIRFVSPRTIQTPVPADDGTDMWPVVDWVATT